MRLRFFVLTETAFSTIMSLIGVIFIILGFIPGSYGWQQLTDGYMGDALKAFGIMAIFFAIGAVFYVPAYKSAKKAALRRLETEREFSEKKFNLSAEENKE